MNGLGKKPEKLRDVINRAGIFHWQFARHERKSRSQPKLDNHKTRFRKILGAREAVKKFRANRSALLSLTQYCDPRFQPWGVSDRKGPTASGIRVCLTFRHERTIFVGCSRV